MDELEKDIEWLKKKSHQRFETKKEAREARRIYKRQTSKKQRQHWKKSLDEMDDAD
jgi:hypothetical protein